MKPDKSTNIIQIWFIITLALLVGISIYLFVATNNSGNNTDTPVSETTSGTTTADVPVAGQRKCIDDPDCASNQFCGREEGICRDKKVAGQSCNRDRQCGSSNCINAVCTVRAACTTDAQCNADQFCGNEKCKDKRVNNEICTRNEQCVSNFCATDGICRTAPTTTGGTTTTGGNTTTGGGSTGNIPVTGLFDSNASTLIILASLCIILGLFVYKTSHKDSLLSSYLPTTEIKVKTISQNDPITEEYEKKFS